LFGASSGVALAADGGPFHSRKDFLEAHTFATKSQWRKAAKRELGGAAKEFVGL